MIYTIVMPLQYLRKKRIITLGIKQNEDMILKGLDESTVTAVFKLNLIANSVIVVMVLR